MQRTTLVTVKVRVWVVGLSISIRVVGLSRAFMYARNPSSTAQHWCRVQFWILVV